MMYFIDTEFYEDGHTIDLISIGIVAEDGREYYACSIDAELHRVSSWLRENVLPKLPPYSDPAWKSRVEIRRDIIEFMGIRYPGGGEEGPSSKIEVWGYYADYDWVVFCQIFGTMMDLPKSFPRFCRDLKQLSVGLGSPRHPPDPEGEHNALIDARWNRDLYKFLRKYGVEYAEAIARGEDVQRGGR